MSFNCRNFKKKITFSTVKKQETGRVETSRPGGRRKVLTRHEYSQILGKSKKNTEKLASLIVKAERNNE